MTTNYETKLLLLDKYINQVNSLDLEAFCSETELTDFIGAKVFAVNLKGEYVLAGTANAISVIEVPGDEIEDKIVLTVDTLDSTIVLDDSVLYTDDFDFEFGYNDAGDVIEYNIYILEYSTELAETIGDVIPEILAPTIDVTTFTASYEDEFAVSQAPLEVTQEINLLNAVVGSTYTWSITDLGSTGSEVTFSIDPSTGETVTLKAIVIEDNTITGSITINVTDGTFSEDFIVEIAINNGAPS